MRRGGNRQALVLKGAWFILRGQEQAEFVPARTPFLVGVKQMTFYLSVVAVVVADTVRAFSSLGVGGWLYFCFILCVVAKFFSMVKKGGRRR